MEDAEARGYQPRIVFVDAANKQIDLGCDPAFVPDGVDELLDPRIGVRQPCCWRSTSATPTPSSACCPATPRRTQKSYSSGGYGLESEVTADELALTIDGLIGDDAERLTGAAALSTVPSVLHEVRVMLDQYWPSVPHVLIEPGVRTGIPLLVDNPKEVGADRIVNCLAAFNKFAKAAIIVDFGSSICVDVVSARGEFLGGAIAPGVQVSSDAAAARSAALRRVELVQPRSVVGKNTVVAWRRGPYFRLRRPGGRTGRPDQE